MLISWCSWLLHLRIHYYTVCFSLPLKKLQIMIQRLEEKEVDFDDDVDSTYIRLQRYYLLCMCVLFWLLCSMSQNKLTEQSEIT